jgi:hypothetical protein
MDEIVFCMGESVRNREHNSESPSNLNFVLVGHSQGGAAIGQVRYQVYSFLTKPGALWQ